MDRELGAHIVLVGIGAIVLLTLVLWSFEKARHLRAFLDAYLRTRRPDWSPEDEPPGDPYDVGINDRDIL